MEELSQYSDIESLPREVLAMTLTSRGLKARIQEHEGKPGDAVAKSIRELVDSRYAELAKEHSEVVSKLDRTSAAYAQEQSFRTTAETTLRLETKLREAVEARLAAIESHVDRGRKNGEWRQFLAIFMFAIGVLVSATQIVASQVIPQQLSTLTSLGIPTSVVRLVVFAPSVIVGILVSYVAIRIGKQMPSISSRAAFRFLQFFHGTLAGGIASIPFSVAANWLYDAIRKP